MGKKTCIECGKQLGVMSPKAECKDGWLCKDCFLQTGMKWSLDELKVAQSLPYHLLKTRAHTVASSENAKVSFQPLKTRAHTAASSKNAKVSFQPTYKCAGIAEFDDKAKQIRVSDEWHDKHLPNRYSQFRYDQIIDFEILEDGATVASGGIGRAVVGGLLFAGVGAVVGAATRKAKGFCYHLSVKITVKGHPEPAFYVTLIDKKTKKAGSEYENKLKAAQDLVSKLQLITNETSGASISPRGGANSSEVVANMSDVSAADEIRKFKKLMDDEIISKDEFDAKKRQLLDL